MTIPNDAPTALIIGGTRGLGRAIALRCIANDVRPIVVGRTAATAQGYPEFSGSLFVTADISKIDEHRRVFDVLNAAKGPRYVFWTAGVYHRAPLIETTTVDVDRLMATHVTGPINFLREFHRSRKMVNAPQPYDLVTVGSVLAYKAAAPQAVFCAVQAAKVQFARAFARELSRDLPGSMSLIINPWAMKTDFFSNSSVKTESFQDPAEVAATVWDQMSGFDRARSLSGKGDTAVEVNLVRAPDGATTVIPGTQMPQL